MKISKNRVKDYKFWHDKKRKYGLSKEQWLMIFNDQDGKCFICNRKLKIGGRTTPRTASTDHCHETGKIRGILCMGCNTRIVPHFEKNTILAKNLFDYLTRETNYGVVPNDSNS